MPVHDSALGFNTASDLYERGRPHVPPDAVAFLAAALRAGPGARVLDLAAGTGRLTAPMRATGATVIALEPLPGMRRAFRTLQPDAPLVAGVAEAIPFGAATMDAVVVSSAFHWFANATALANLHRVLKPGGRLGLLWNARDQSIDWVEDLLNVIDRHRGHTPTYREGRWRQTMADFDRFRPVETRVFAFAQTATPDVALAAVASISFIARLPQAERARVLEAVRTLVEQHMDDSPEGIVTIPYTADVYIYEAR